jgi:hypothetical protein
MRLYTTLAVTAAAAALTFNLWPGSGDMARPVFVDEVAPAIASALVAETDDDLTLMLRQQARAAVLELQQRQAQL